jgi:TetR/AcrR family transcriptional repressor of lmrAB and yxaGH operons
VTSPTRDRMIEAAVRGLQRRGLAGMSFTEVLAGSGAARGAIYHHFPGGKKQLVAEAAARHGADVRDHLGTLPTGSPRAIVEGFLAMVRPAVVAATGGSGCAVAAVTVRLDADSAELCGIAATAFAAWTDRLARALTDAGLGAGPAGDLAALLVALLEGAQVVCRATGDPAPFDRAARACLALVGAGDQELP